MRSVRRACVALVIALTAGLSIGLPTSAAVAGSVPATSFVAQEASTDTAAPTTTAFDWSCSKPAIVKPNCGVKPEQAGDRGGALQYTVWGLLVLGLIVVFTVVFRSAVRTNRRKVNEVGDRNWS